MCGQFAAFCFSLFCCLFVLQRTTLLKKNSVLENFNLKIVERHIERLHSCEYRPMFRFTQVQLPTDQNRHMQCKVRCQNHTCKYVSGHSATSLLAMYSSIQLLENMQFTVDGNKSQQM